MEKPRGVIKRALTSGTVSGIATAIAAALAGKREDGSYAAPLNATSHVLWGDKAAHQDDASLKYTLTGLLLNHAAAIFWALFYEKWFGRRGTGSVAGTAGADEARSLAKPILGAAAVTAGAYVTDYYLIPERFTPGFEKRLSGKSLATIFGILAVGLVACDLIDAAKSRRR
ncbi:hypothetical protein SAMN05216420_104118 [Nitrosospira sp. Nl5]|uniref:hypothetical protein n=1 Tax=Nitrosospira sp. Nl5 TaxID=200120 RepID=UPI00087FA0B2|nr:hypothetical protein [Nitrosospira sp. Nl5]SCY28785.1 hypothetical protein SAMN05216420_104118 [Nitrosospira sp. Nl5]